MRGVLFYLKGKGEPWAATAAEEYKKKISHFFDFELVAIRSKSEDRAHAEEKKRAEATALLSKIGAQDWLILFDEDGKGFKSSVDFSEELVKVMERSPQRIAFAIGGPYGFDSSVRERAQMRWNLSPLTMNHHVAQVVALEQIYRALTIWKGLPYHNHAR